MSPEVNNSMTECVIELRWTHAVCFDKINVITGVGLPLVVRVMSCDSQLFRSGTALLSCGCAAEGITCLFAFFLRVSSYRILTWYCGELAR